MGEEAVFDSAAASTLVNDLRSVFRSRRTRSLKWREEQLKAIIRMFTEREAELIAALDKDLGKPAFETYMCDIHFTIRAAKDAIANLKKWTAPKQVPTNLENFPSKSKTVPEPLGVILNIAPWNYPYVLSFEPMIGMIAAGNAVVLKPSDSSPHSSSLMGELVGVYLDTTAIKVVEGGVGTATALLEQKWDKIMYTGNPVVARIVLAAAAKHLTPVLLELGGKNPVLVDSTANITMSAKRILSGRMLNSGQTCISPEYVLAEKEVADKLVSSMDEAFDIVNDRPKCLSLYAFTTSKAFCERVINETSAGSVCINETVLQVLNANLPFGGVGNSGSGSYKGRYSFDSFSHHKAVMIKQSNTDPLARFPPYTPFKSDFFRAFLNRDFVGLSMLMLGKKK